MPSHEEKRVLPFSASEMFAVVADIEKYPEFVPGCAGLRILDRKSAGNVETIIAEMMVSFGALRETYTSKVTLDRNKNIVDAHHIDGPFDHLDTRWCFVPRDSGSEVHFAIDFAFRNRLLAAASNLVFDRMVRKTTGAFIARAAQRHNASHHAQQ
jgi:coenzyme Q-binding protein COQ10